MIALELNELEQLNGGDEASYGCSIGLGSSATMIAFGVGLAFPLAGLVVGLALNVGAAYLCEQV